MPPVAIAIGVAAVGVGVAGYGMIQQSKQAKAAAKAQKEANAIQRQQAQLQGMRQRLDAIRTGRQALAQVQQTAENQGVASSSAAEGGQGSIVSQMMSNVSFLDGYNHMTDLAQDAMGKAYYHQNKSDMWGAVSNFGFTLASNAAGFIK